VILEKNQTLFIFFLLLDQIVSWNCGCNQRRL